MPHASPRVVLAAALLLLGVPALSGATPPTQSQCESAWEDSAADDTCDNENISVHENNCSIGTSCTDTNGQTVGQNFLISLEYVDDLNNCNGRLKVGNC